MSIPVEGSGALVLAVVLGFIFGWLLHLGRVTDYNVIVNQFRLRDFTVLKVMLTAIVVGGVGVLVLKRNELASYHVKPADMLAVAAWVASALSVVAILVSMIRARSLRQGLRERRR